MDERQEFSSLTTKFLFLNCDSENNESIKSELNSLLNELNSIDYNKQKCIDQMTALRLLDSFTKIPSNEETLIVKSCYLISIIVNKQKIQLQDSNFQKVIEWLLKSLNFNLRSAGSDILSAMQVLFRSHPQCCEKYLDALLSPDGLLLKLIDKDFHIKRNLKEDYDAISSEEISLHAMLCLESLVIYLGKSEENDKFEDTLIIVGKKLIDILYHNNLKFENNCSKLSFLAATLNSLHAILTTCKDWFEQNIGEVLGISQAFMLYGLPDYQYVRPQKVMISQQSVFEHCHVPEVKGGKVAKTRKPRTINKNKKNKNKTQKPNEVAAETENDVKMEIDNLFLTSFNKTSDSDFSESESGRSQNERHKESKLRLAAISLIGLTAKTMEKKIMYGYWHSIFPSENCSSQRGILSCVLKDSNARCKVAALQAASLFFLGSKPFLIQAENSEKTPSTFMPFSVALSNMIIAAYCELTQALSTESSLPVLTQILKCLAVLIQATPFHRLNSGFVEGFVKYIRKLIYHKDPTIQVAALMVMEFLISVQEMTTEISECIGLKDAKTVKKKNQNQLNDVGINQFIEAQQEDEYLDSDYEEHEPSNDKQVSSEMQQEPSERISWLLHRVLENLGVKINPLKKHITPATTPVRIESLQILSVMAPHFELIKMHLPVVSTALITSLNDPLPEIRLYAGKTLDVIGHSINTHLLEKGPDVSEDLLRCQDFWTEILPSVVSKIQDHQQSSTLKASLCDFLSNIGVHVFERLPQTQRIQLISLLSGVGFSEDGTTRAAAVRALAVYTLFPSLRDDLCFIENTAESIVQLIKDPNLYVRIKASWSIGNVSDALISSSADSLLDRISNSLLQRMLETSIDAAGDNDKVRSNAVRTIGNLLRLVTADLLKLEIWKSLSLRAIRKLVQNVTTGGNAKVKWNSCYAIGNFMQNPAFFEKTSKDFNWQNDVFPALCDLIKNSVNFKVRINGSIALSSLNTREKYGNHFIAIWKSFLSALEQSNTLVDFNEYKHRDSLQEQLCLSIAHMIKISHADEYASLKNELIPKLESTKKDWIRVLNRILPENAAPLLECSAFLRDLLRSERLSNDNMKCVEVLASCFIPPQEFL